MSILQNCRIKRALLSVSNKDGIVSFARGLKAHGIELISTGGTAQALIDGDVAVRDVATLTGFPEMLDGRVKTLHPHIYGGLLARRDDPAHMATLAEHSILEIDLLVVNLYPFESVVATGGDHDQCIENIDIGGSAMLRAAAKNHASLTCLVDPNDYQKFIDSLEQNGGTIHLEERQYFAQKCFAYTAAYDAAISNWMATQFNITAPDYIGFGGRRSQNLRYGENPHQNASFFVSGIERAGVASATQIQGKKLSYNNINDTDAAYELVAEFDSNTPTCAIIKHANPCGVARAQTLCEAFLAARKCDPVSAFGGIIATNVPLDQATAEAITETFVEVVIAPDADPQARAVFAQKKNIRLLCADSLPDANAQGLQLRQVAGGLLVQSRDASTLEQDALKIVTQRAPTDTEMADLIFAFTVAKHVKSNAVVFAKDATTVGIGAGQMSRLDSTRIAAQKGHDVARAATKTTAQVESLTKGAVVASDAFFPFADGVLAVAKAGATAIIQPGGSMRDQEVIDAANATGLAMVFTNIRHFRH